jgi:putative transposase
LELRQVDVVLGRGKSVQWAVQQIGVTAQTCFRRRNEYGGMDCDQFKRLKAPDVENQRLRRCVSDPAAGRA